MSEFKRERRYLVLKFVDLSACLTVEEKKTLSTLAHKVESHRLMHGKEDLECAVVESDWPEYEPTWKAIEDRVKAESTGDSNE